MEYKNELEFKFILKSNQDNTVDKLNKFRDIFCYVFKNELDEGEITPIITVIKTKKDN